jgi:NADPH:quinone reductase-like Zn-dependent oxidoreductase
VVRLPDHYGVPDILLWLGQAARATLADLTDTGKLRPHVAHTLPLAEAAKAHELIESGSIQGKIVLIV